MTALPHILAKVINTPLMLHPRAAVTIYNALSGRFGTAAMEFDYSRESYSSVRWFVHTKASRFTGDRVKTDDGKFPAVEPFTRTPDGVALITVDGELCNRGAYIGADSGLVSYEGVKWQLSRAARDPKTRAILLDLNSPGGEAIGATEMASAVRQAADAKPVYAVANGMAMSAAYALASGATRVFAAPSSFMGSVGVIMLHMDFSGALEKAGIAPTLIFAGAHKADGNPTEPLTEGVTAELQADIDRFYEDFLSTVAAGRGRRMSAKAARATEARTYIGADSVAVGLADAVGTFEDVLGELTSKVVRASSRKVAAQRAALTGAPAMAENDTETELAIKMAADNAYGEGLKKGQDAGMKAAHDRISTIMADPRVKGNEIFALKLAAKSQSMSAEDIGATCEDLPKMIVGETQLGNFDAPKALYAQVEATGVNGIRPGPAPNQPGGGGWDAAVAKANARLPRNAAQV